LKGTDGEDVLQQAIELGAEPNAINRAREFLKELLSIRPKLKFITCPGIMGSSILEELNYSYETISHPLFANVKDDLKTTAEHTIISAELIKNRNDIKLLVFFGGDGTARDVVKAVNKDIPCLGIPTGVKIYSSVFSLNPRIAASIVIQFLWDEIPLRESEVLDIDEEEYRKGNLVSKLYGYLLTPFNPDFTQRSKMGTPDSDLNNQERIAKRIVEEFEKDTCYLLGPGTTIKAITDILNQEKTVLGIDLLLNNRIIAHDLNERRILEHINGKKVKIITSLIGRQGFLFGRGNLQFTPQVLRKIGIENVIIIATKFKLMNIPDQILRIDTRDPQLDDELKGFYRVIVDYDEMKICKVV